MYRFKAITLDSSVAVPLRNDLRPGDLAALHGTVYAQECDFGQAHVPESLVIRDPAEEEQRRRISS